VTGCVNVGVANLYADATFCSEVISQAILGESLKYRDELGDFSLVQLADGYSGWINNHQWIKGEIAKGESIILRSHFAPVYVEPDNSSRMKRDAVLGATFLKIGEEENWNQVLLPDMQKGWIAKRNFNAFPRKSRKDLVIFSQEFLGYPYFWGGRSPKGFDCSGLTQTIFTLTGIPIPRDSWMQHRDGTHVGNSPLDAQPGDLYFFSENSNGITHVGLSIGDGKILHARGFVRINSLIENTDDFDSNLLDSFVEIKSYIQ